MGRTAKHKRDWCSQCNCWHYEGDLHLDEQIAALEAELVELREAVDWYQRGCCGLHGTLCTDAGGVKPDTSYNGEWYDTFHDALLAAYKATKLESEADDG